MQKLRRKMSTEIHTESLSAAFRHWPNLAMGAILLALSTFLATIATNMIPNATTQLQGWVVLVIAGYSFVSALYLAVSPLSEHSPLPQAFPGVIDHFKSFIVGAIFYAIGYFILNIEVSKIAANQPLTQILALIVGGALFLVAAVVAVAGAFAKPRK